MFVGPTLKMHCNNHHLLKYEEKSKLNYAHLVDQFNGTLAFRNSINTKIDLNNPLSAISGTERKV